MVNYEPSSIHAHKDICNSMYFGEHRYIDLDKLPIAVIEENYDFRAMPK